MTEVVKTEDVLGGKARIAGRRVSIFQIGELYTEAAYSPEEISDQLSLSLGEVHSALAYYYEHPDEMEQIAARRDELISLLRDQSNVPEELSQ